MCGCLGIVVAVVIGLVVFGGMPIDQAVEVAVGLGILIVVLSFGSGILNTIYLLFSNFTSKNKAESFDVAPGSENNSTLKTEAIEQIQSLPDRTNEGN